MPPNQIKKVKSIASIVGDDGSLDGKFCIDDKNRIWNIKTRHSGCILEGNNTDAVIPYWTCYYIELPGLKVMPEFELLPWAEDKPTLLEELLRLSVKKGDLIRDENNGLLWCVRVNENGISLEGYDANHSMPTCSLGILSFGKLTRLSTQEQRNNRKIERTL